MPSISQVFFTAIFFYPFSCFRIAEAHLDVIFQRKWHFRWRYNYTSYT